MTKYKYYFKKPKGEITKDILTCVLTAGTIAVAASSPYFIANVLRAFLREGRKEKYKKKEIFNAFYRLRKQGCFHVEEENNQIYISLTDEGRKKAGWFQINHLKIKTPKRWDKNWWIIIFDISHTHRAKREAFRGLIKRLGLRQLQKSVWIYPYDCCDEIELLKDFFGLDAKELRCFVTKNIGDDIELRKYFNLI